MFKHAIGFEHIKDISEQVELAKFMVDASTPGDNWRDYIDWKELIAEGVTHVRIDGKVYEYTKFGPSWKQAAS